MRALWSLPLNWGTLAGWGLTLLTPALLFHKGVTRLMLFTLLALLPGAVQPMLLGNSGDRLLCLATIAMGTLSAPVMLRGLNVWQSDKRVTQTEDMVSVCFLLALLLGRLQSTVAVRLADWHDLRRVFDGGGGFLSGRGAGTLMGMLGGISLAAQGYPLDRRWGLVRAAFWQD